MGVCGSNGSVRSSTSVCRSSSVCSSTSVCSSSSVCSSTSVCSGSSLYSFVHAYTPLYTCVVLFASLCKPMLLLQACTALTIGERPPLWHTAHSSWAPVSVSGAMLCMLHCKRQPQVNASKLSQLSSQPVVRGEDRRVVERTFRSPRVASLIVGFPPHLWHIRWAAMATLWHSSRWHNLVLNGAIVGCPVAQDAFRFEVLLAQHAALALAQLGKPTKQ